METAVVFLPALAAIVAGFFGRWIGDRGAQLVTVGAVSLAAILAWVLFVDVGYFQNARETVRLFTWIDSGTLEVSWSVRVDTLTAVMLMVVTTVSALVHIYSIGYMSHDPDKPRFMAYLSLFTFAMLMLVTADDLVQLFFGWEGVGLASYLLIGFWYKKSTANAAAIKAFLVNRVGDFGLVLGIAAVYLLFGTVEFDAIFAAAPEMAEVTISFLGMTLPALEVACLLLFMGAMGKSAQLLLHTWLPDAMEGPTPVSALIHAATMVTAGVFLVCRMSPVYEFAPVALGVITIMGALTAFVAATIGMTQFDIKRVIAYSTMSQLGYMFFAAGVGAYGAAMFHLTTHAFFKALLFLGAGSVIHALSDEQDLRKMGGLARHIRVTWMMMLVGTLALTGLPLLSGFYSKDIVLEAAFASGMTGGMFAYWVGCLVAILTTFYSFRLFFMAFHGAPRADEKTMAHVHESPHVMLIPLAVLALGALLAGRLLYGAFVGDERYDFWAGSLVAETGDSVYEAHYVEFWVKALPTVAFAIGLLWAAWFYIWQPGIPKKLVPEIKGIHLFVFRKWFFDELYDWVFVRPSFWLGRVLWRRGDGQTIDGFGPDGVSWLARRVAVGVSWVQSGYVYHYAFAMLIGVVALVSWYLAVAG